MAAILKHKYMPRTALTEDFALPTTIQQIAQVMGTKGSNLHEVRTAEGDVILVSLPSRFRKLTWVKWGYYVLVEPIAEGKKVKGEIVKVLSKEHIAYLQEEGVWPNSFTEQRKQEEEKQPASDSEDDLWRNPNRPVLTYAESSESDSESSNDEDSSECENCSSEDEEE
ncbi:probable RNA-binding protein EIF1AD [Dendroctonus ponderosae]|uniref:Probable RNA-binding protein EIF1AD n=1 Tax=Dendroctonus ponderosae TaxID=77166 RepID=U4V0R3_DENPD|nr:probable RNA-binding protein EIF1AD [Dendroctonus ponderosae]ERL96260.1 hypothetical protein D910_01671 [Dendroctonus ponderosae]KAH1019842.1 hypothetical protein HUJ04_009603 [Dendroctonus ponderosae]KAH1026960.1 hypothetical protein HUJ05_000548 [Dendroctonus ponderosae]